MGMVRPGLEKYRVKSGFFKSNEGDQFGLFFIPYGVGKTPLKVLCAPFDHPFNGWEHVSVSLPKRCPTWEEMSFVKDLFWDETEVVVQFHPAKKDYINTHPFCLHLWKKQGENLETPQTFLIG